MAKISRLDMPWSTVYTNSDSTERSLCATPWVDASKVDQVRVTFEIRELLGNIQVCVGYETANVADTPGSHTKIGFRATGEPDTRPSEPLKARDGKLEIKPLTNGPLQVKGNLEICAGTGRNVDRVTTARLCRCGGSKNKPFCDNTHLKIGFRSDH